MVGVVNSQLLAGQDEHRFLEIFTLIHTKSIKKEKDATDAIKTVKKNARQGTKFEKTVFRHMKNYGNIQQKAFITSNVEKRWLMGAL